MYMVYTSKAHEDNSRIAVRYVKAPLKSAKQAKPNTKPTNIHFPFLVSPDKRNGKTMSDVRLSKQVEKIDYSVDIRDLKRH